MTDAPGPWPSHLSAVSASKSKVLKPFVDFCGSLENFFHKFCFFTSLCSAGMNCCFGGKGEFLRLQVVEILLKLFGSPLSAVQFSHALVTVL